MIVRVLPVGLLQANCYFLIDEATNHAAIVDPGGSPDQIIAFVNEHKWEVTKVLLTHGHFDHVDAMEDMREYFDAKVYIHKKEADYLSEPGLSLSTNFLGVPKTYKADVMLSDGDEIEVGESVLKVITVPGHTLASVCYYNKKDEFLIVGDTVFRESIGRTDLYPGVSTDLPRNIKEKLWGLPDQVIIYPGHGPSTTIAHEKKSNFYLRVEE